MSAPETHRLTGAQIVVEYRVRQGVSVVAGIPGHGSRTLTDVLLDRADAIRTIQVMHEQSAVHLADGHCRATGRAILAFTSIGPGAANAVVGVAAAYVDSTAIALMTPGRRPTPGYRGWRRRDHRRRGGRGFRPEGAVRRALASGGPSLVHIVVDRDLVLAAPDKTGWWDAPSPAYERDRYARWQAGVAEEQHR